MSTQAQSDTPEYTITKELTLRYTKPVFVIRRNDGTLVATTAYQNRIKGLIARDMAA